jgi:hypothetical protein
VHTLAGRSAVANQALYATRIKSMAGARPVIGPTRDRLGDQGGSEADVTLLEGASVTPRWEQQWSDLGAAELIELAEQVEPVGETARCVTYAGPDLVWAQPMTDEAL